MNASTESTHLTPHPRARLWPAGLILTLAAALTVYVRWFGDIDHQWRNLYTISIGILSVLLLLIWVLFLSRLRWKSRWLIFGGTVAMIGALAGTFRLHGVTGDWVPIFRFRWTQAPLPIPIKSSSPTAMPARLENAEGSGASFPQFMGPERNASVAESPRLARDWANRPPQLLWRQTVGLAWSGFAIVGQRAITQEQRGDREAVVCYELLTGRTIWVHEDPARYISAMAGEGPRATPTIVGDKVVTVGATGVLNCLDLATGNLVWTKDIVADNQSLVPQWGFAASPLVMDDLVVVQPGGKNGRSLVAYHLKDGSFAWGGGDDDASYSSPYAATLDGVLQVIMISAHAISGHDAGSGQVLWQLPWGKGMPNVALPLVFPGDRVLISSGYGIGSALLQIKNAEPGKFAAEPIWRNNRMKAKFNNIVTRNGYIYGLDDGILACVEVATGDLKWKDGRYGHGQFVLLPDALLLMAENGEVVLLDPLPDGRHELTKFQALTTKTWNPPALVGNVLIVRNDQEAACFRLPLKE